MNYAVSFSATLAAFSFMFERDMVGALFVGFLSFSGASYMWNALKVDGIVK